MRLENKVKKGGEGNRRQRWEERLEVKFGVKGREKKGGNLKRKKWKGK